MVNLKDLIPSNSLILIFLTEFELYAPAGFFTGCGSGRVKFTGNGCCINLIKPTGTGLGCGSDLTEPAGGTIDRLVVGPEPLGTGFGCDIDCGVDRKSPFINICVTENA